MLSIHSFNDDIMPVYLLQLLKSGTLSLQLFECVPAMILSAINSRPTTSSWPSNPLSASSLAPQIRLWLSIVRVYKLYLLTYLLNTLTETADRLPSFCQHRFKPSWHKQVSARVFEPVFIQNCWCKKEFEYNCFIIKLFIWKHLVIMATMHNYSHRSDFCYFRC